MNPRKPIAALGAAATTFLLVGVVVIEAVAAATGADVGPGIVGVGVGALAELAALLLVGWRWDATSEPIHHVLLAYATVGLVFLFLSALSYVNVPGARTYLSVPLNVGIAVVAALVVAVVLRQTGRRSSAG